MAIKALFPSGQDAITVTGLYQWDYGQVLEIESFDMGSEIVEVHFACTNMSEAIVRPCTFSNGIGTVTIPDDCLEQSTPITAWIYEIEGTQGKTRKVITLPVIARTRPSIARDIPTVISNRYTELITEVNEAIDALENGNVTVKQAQNATTADSAKTAGNASTVNYATSAGTASTANKATVAVKNEDGVFLTDMLHAKLGFNEYFRAAYEEEELPIDHGVIVFKIKDPSDNTTTQFITEVGGEEMYPNFEHVSAVFYGNTNEGHRPMRLRFKPAGNAKFRIVIQSFNGTSWVSHNFGAYETMQIHYKHLFVYGYYG